MRILHVTQGYWPAIGGTEHLIQRISEEMVAQFSDEVTVFTTNCFNGEGFWNPRAPRMKPGWEVINGVKICRFPVMSHVSALFRPIQKIWYRLRLPRHDLMRTIFAGPLIPKLSKEIRGYPADVVGASSFPLMHMYDALKGAKTSNKPLVFHGGLHPQDKWGFERAMIYSAINKADHYIANTQYEKHFLELRGIPKDKITVIGVGVDPESFNLVSESKARELLRLPESGPIIGFVGQIGYHKGIETLLKAMPRVWREFPNSTLLIAGARTSYVHDIEQIIATELSPYRERIRLILNFDNEIKPLIYQSLDVFVYPSGFESFGIAFLEAWAAKKPVIGCRRGAIPWVVNAGEDGLLIEYRNPRALAEAILHLLYNPNWATSLAQSGYEKTCKHYTWQAVARKFRQVYQECNLVYREK